jgi:molybdopterin-guanine dinucleotide biosynthesis protein A
MQTKPPLIAIILCGGQSSRMGEPKAFIAYHGMPQYKWLYQQCRQLDLPVYLSCNEAQEPLFDNEFAPIVDLENYRKAGPMTGLLSAAEQYPGVAILLLACDYPGLQLSNLKALQTSYLMHQKSTCFVHPETGMEEPLLAIYSPLDLKQIKLEYTEGKHSLRHYLNKADTTSLTPTNILSIKSADTPADKEMFGL